MSKKKGSWVGIQVFHGGVKTWFQRGSGLEIERVGWWESCDTLIIWFILCLSKRKGNLVEACRKKYSRFVSSLGLDWVDNPEIDVVWVKKEFVGVKERDLVSTVCRMGIIPGIQRRERTSLDEWGLGFFERLWDLSFCFVNIVYSIGLRLEDESLVLISSSNAVSLGNLDVKDVVQWISGDGWEEGLEFVLWLVDGFETLKLVNVVSRIKLGEQSVGCMLEGNELYDIVKSDNSLSVEDELSYEDSCILIWKGLSFLVCLRWFVDGG